jgi:hypothetical protein
MFVMIIFCLSELQLKMWMLHPVFDQIMPSQTVTTHWTLLFDNLRRKYQQSKYKAVSPTDQQSISKQEI